MARKHAKRFNRKPQAFDSSINSTDGLTHYNSTAENYARLRRNGWSAKDALAIAHNVKKTRELNRSFSYDCPLENEPDGSSHAFDTQWREEVNGLIVRVEFCNDDATFDDSDCLGEMTRRSESAGWQHETTPGEAGEEVYAWHWNYKEAFAHHRRTMARHDAHLRVLGDMRREFQSYLRHAERVTFGIIVTVFDADGNELAEDSVWGFDYSEQFEALLDSDMIGEALSKAAPVYASIEAAAIAPDIAAHYIDARGV